MRWLTQLLSIRNQTKNQTKEQEKKEAEIMYMIAGLGNPDKKYDNTRHNIGFDTIDKIAQEYQISMSGIECRAACGKGMIAGERVMLVKPLTYMNNSGEAVGALLRYYKLLPASQLLVIYDDISLEPGNIRIRLKGSAGGHNGIKNIIAHTGTQEFARIKIGVGQKPPQWDLADYVLSRFPKEERKRAESAMDDAVKAAQMLVSGDAAQAMNLYNKKKV